MPLHQRPSSAAWRLPSAAVRYREPVRAAQAPLRPPPADRPGRDTPSHPAEAPKKLGIFGDDPGEVLVPAPTAARNVDGDCLARDLLHGAVLTSRGFAKRLGFLGRESEGHWHGG